MVTEHPAISPIQGFAASNCLQEMIMPGGLPQDTWEMDVHSSMMSSQSSSKLQLSWTHNLTLGQAIGPAIESQALYKTCIIESW